MNKASKKLVALYGQVDRMIIDFPRSLSKVKFLLDENHNNCEIRELLKKQF